MHLLSIDELIWKGFAHRMDGVRGLWLTEKGHAFIRGLQLNSMRGA